MYICIHVYIYICVYMYICIYVYTCVYGEYFFCQDFPEDFPHHTPHLHAGKGCQVNGKGNSVYV